MADEKTHRIEIDIPGLESGEPGKLIIDGNDLSKFAHEVRIVLSAGKVPQIQVDLYGIDGIGAKLEEAGLILNVTKPGEEKGESVPDLLRSIDRQLSRLGRSITDLGAEDAIDLPTPKMPRSQILAAFFDAYPGVSVKGDQVSGSLSGMSDPRK